MTAAARIRVVVVDDHAVVRTGLGQLLGATDDIEVVGEAADGSAALRVVADAAPDVVLMDLQMPGVDGVEATRAVLAAHPEVQVLVLTSYSDAERIVAALDA
ncbi:MAG TPA: response regulator transcription factor, partial [Nocardioides sp.]|nr:response regulator transcription factor [Nocardioides sp.]